MRGVRSRFASNAAALRESKEGTLVAALDVSAHLIAAATLCVLSYQTFIAPDQATISRQLGLSNSDSPVIAVLFAVEDCESRMSFIRALGSSQGSKFPEVRALCLAVIPR